MTREDWSKADDLLNILKEAGQVYIHVKFIEMKINLDLNNTIFVLFFFKQEIPSELVSMAERFGAWKERKDEERKRNAAGM